MSYIRKVVPTIKIECWSTIINQSNPFLAPEIRGLQICGKVYGHPTKNDGTYVKTSLVEGVQGRIIFTQNSIYELGEPDSKFLSWMKIQGMEFNSEEPIKIIIK